MSEKVNSFELISSSLADAVDAASSAIVMVVARRRMPSTGIAYTADLVVTASHAIEQEDNVKIILADGRKISASLAGRDPARDIALLKVQDAVLSPAVIAQKPARVGQLVLALGRPDENGLQASLGVISAIGGPVHMAHGGILEKYLRTDTVPFPGFSGGPLIAVDGTVVGMNTSGLAMETLIALPVDILWPAAEALAAHGHIRRPYLGIRSQTVALAASQQQAISRNQSHGLLLVGIEENTPAATAGLMVGDILVGIHSHPIEDHDELQVRLNAEEVGKAVPIEVLRGATAETIQVTLGER